MPQIRPITDLRNTNEISDICHTKNEPIFITKNGYGDLVIMSIETYEKMLEVNETDMAIREAEVEYAAGEKLMDARETLNLLASSVIEGNEGVVLQSIDKVAKLGKNITQISKDLIGYIRDILVVKTCKDYEDILKLPINQIKDLKFLADKVESSRLIGILNKLSRLENEYRYSTNPRGLLEISLVSLCSDNETDINELKMKVKLLESKINKG